MAKNDGGPAFPHPEGWRRDPEISDGMSLRDWFAGMAMPEIIAAVSRGDHQIEFATEGLSIYQGMAFDAYAMADAMIYARTNKNGDG